MGSGVPTALLTKLPGCPPLVFPKVADGRQACPKVRSMPLRRRLFDSRRRRDRIRSPAIFAKRTRSTSPGCFGRWRNAKRGSLVCQNHYRFWSRPYRRWTFSEPCITLTRLTTGRTVSLSVSPGRWPTVGSALCDARPWPEPRICGFHPSRICCVPQADVLAA